MLCYKRVYSIYDKNYVINREDAIFYFYTDTYQQAVEGAKEFNLGDTVIVIEDILMNPKTGECVIIKPI